MLNEFFNCAVSTTLNYSDVIRAPWRFKPAATRLFVQQVIQTDPKENITTLRHWTFRNPPSPADSPPPTHTHTQPPPPPPTPTMGQQMRKVFLYHDAIMCCMRFHQLKTDAPNGKATSITWRWTPGAPFLATWINLKSAWINNHMTIDQ